MLMMMMLLMMVATMMMTMRCSAFDHTNAKPNANAHLHNLCEAIFLEVGGAVALNASQAAQQSQQ